MGPFCSWTVSFENVRSHHHATAIATKNHPALSVKASVSFRGVSRRFFTFAAPYHMLLPVIRRMHVRSIILLRSILLGVVARCGPSGRDGYANVVFVWVFTPTRARRLSDTESDGFTRVYGVWCIYGGRPPSLSLQPHDDKLVIELCWWVWAAVGNVCTFAREKGKECEISSEKLNGLRTISSLIKYTYY